MRRRLLAINPVSHPGGAETTLMRLLTGLNRKGWTVDLTTPGPGPLRDAAREAGYGWHALPLGGIERGHGLRAVGSWTRARVMAESADAVLLNGAVTGRLLPALVPGASRGRVRGRVLLHVHDMVQRVPAFWRRADVVLTVSYAAAQPLGGLDPHVVYCPVDPDPPPAEAPWPADVGPVIGFVGRIEPRKSPLDLVRAAPRILRESPGARIVLLGDEPPYAPDHAYTEAVLTGALLEHHPWREDAAGLMRHLDVLVLPSYREPFGTVLAEAMAVGTPVVATRVDGLPEVVADGATGRLVAPGDPEALAEAVLEVLAHREQMGAAAAERAKRFHTEAYVERVERLLVGAG